MQAVELPVLVRALQFAAIKHRDQRRKDVEASPYINHPIAVLAILADEAGITDPDVLCAAVLHDTLEDTQTTAAELEMHFGATVRDLVIAVSDDKSLPKAERKRRQIANAAHASAGARLVKLADKTANLRDLAAHPPHQWDAHRRHDYCTWALAVVEQIRGTHAGLEALFDEAHGRCAAPGGAAGAGRP